MRTAAPLWLPIFRSDGQARLLATLVLAEPEPLPLSSLATRARLSKGAVSKEVRRLEEAGIVATDRRANLRLVRLNDDSPLYPDLRSLLLKVFGPVTVLEDALAGVRGIELAYIHGSWAARYVGEPGGPPGDIDLLVVGEPKLDDVYASCRRAAERLGRDVQPVILSRQEWEDPERGFVRTLRERPLIPVRVAA